MSVEMFQAKVPWPFTVPTNLSRWQAICREDFWLVLRLPNRSIWAQRSLPVRSCAVLKLARGEGANTRQKMRYGKRAFKRDNGFKL